MDTEYNIKKEKAKVHVKLKIPVQVWLEDLLGDIAASLVIDSK